MTRRGFSIARRGVRTACIWAAAAVLAGGVLWLAVGGPDRVPIAQGASLPRVLTFSDQARRVLVLQYRPSSIELMGCMIGEVRGDTVRVERIAPADVAPSHSTATHVVPERSCEQAGWAGTVGTIHTHPAGERCWYFFPGTRVPSSDGQSSLRSRYPVDAILCGDHVVWIGRGMIQKHLRVGAGR